MKFELNGYNIENLLKTLYNKKVTLFNIERQEHNRVSFEVLDKHEKKVKRYISNFKVKKTLSRAKQIPKIIVANIGILLGVFVGVIFSVFASAYTWQIKVFGTKDLTSQEILQVLEQNGIKKGKINLVSSEEIETILLNNYDRIAQVSVIKQGTSIIINLSEKLVYIEEEYEPIKAKYSGIITNINIITGTTNVKVGDYVNIGDILVLPFNLNSKGEKVSVKPLAEISAKIFIMSKVVLPKSEQVLTRTGKTCIEYKYKLFNFNLFSGKNKNSFANFEIDVYNENVSDLLPFSRDVYTYHEMALTTIEHNFEQEKSSLIEKSKQQAYNNMPVGKIEEEKTTTSIVDEKLYACTTLTILGLVHD